MIDPSEAWTLARLLAGQSVNGELKTIAEPFRRLAELLDGLAPEARQAAWDAAMTNRDDRDDLISAIAAVDPSGPQPEPDPREEGDAADDWEPIRLGALPQAIPFPLDVLPLPARDLAEAAAESIGCPVDFPAVGILAAASGLIGRSASLLIKGGRFASGSLYVALVGSPSRAVFF